MDSPLRDMPKKIDSIYYTEEQLFRENIKTIDRIMSKEMSLQKESGTVKLHLDLSPSCQVKTIDGKPLDFIPEVKIPSLQKESEWESTLEYALPDRLTDDEKQIIRNNVSLIISNREK